MSISSINSSAPLPGMTTRAVAADTPAAEARQAATPPKSSAVQLLTPQSVEQSQKAEASRDELEEAVKAANDFVKPFNNGIEFNLDDESGRTIVKVIDLATEEVIRQFPSKEMLAIAKALDQMKGLLIQQKA